MVITVSASGYLNDEISFEWLYHFNKYTQKLAVGAKRLLLLDEYGSHHTMPFIQYCDDNNIILFGFPPHTTHILQPLDVMVFQPYKNYHSKAINTAVRDGCLKFTKLEFLAAIGDIRRQTFKASTIQSAFKKTGLIPYNLQVVLEKIKPKTPPMPPTEVPQLETTPFTIRSLKRQAQYLYKNAPQDDPEFTYALDRFIRGSLTQGTELLQTMKDLGQSQLAEQARQARKADQNRPLKAGGVLTVQDGRAMVEKVKEDKRAKAEATIRRLDERYYKATKRAFFDAAKKARDWRLKGVLKPLYIIDRQGCGRCLRRG